MLPAFSTRSTLTLTVFAVPLRTQSSTLGHGRHVKRSADMAVPTFADPAQSLPIARFADTDIQSGINYQLFDTLHICKTMGFGHDSDRRQQTLPGIPVRYFNRIRSVSSCFINSVISFSICFIWMDINSICFTGHSMEARSGLP